jgi:hypothetical protein
VVTHNADQVFYFDSDGLQRRMDYIVEINGSTLVGHYTSRYKNFGAWRSPPAAAYTAAIPTTPSTSTCPQSPWTSVTSN